MTINYMSRGLALAVYRRRERGPQPPRDRTRLTRLKRTAMSGLSSGTYSWGGDAGRCLGGGDGDRLLKKVKMVLFFFFFLAAAFAPFAGPASTGISSSVGGAEESAESESEPDMVAVEVVVRGGGWSSTREERRQWPGLGAATGV